MSDSAASPTPQPTRMPDAFVILFFVAIFAAALSHLLPAGQFVTETQIVNGSEREMIVPGSYQTVSDADSGIPLFADDGGNGLLNVPFEGLVAGSKWGSAVGVVAFILVIGGAFGMIMETGAINRGIIRLIERGGRLQSAIIPILFFLFSLGGAVFGMGEEAIAFCILLVPLMIKLGFDSITAILVTYVATQIGFATSWMNPFSVAIAQGIAGLPVLSGAAFRIGLWLIFTLFGIAYTIRYAYAVKADPKLSLSRISDSYIGEQSRQQSQDEKVFGWVDSAIITLLFLGIGWVIWGVVLHQYYIPQIASQFFAIGLACACIAIFSSQNPLTANASSAAFMRGAADLLPAALIVGMAKGVVLLLGGDDPTEPSVLNTLLQGAGESIQGLGESVAALLMFVIQSVFNFFIASGSGQAALTMPLMAPLSDLVGVSRQVAVLAFQLGDGLTNIIIPTSASLVGCLGVARLDWSLWFRFIWRLMLWLMGLSAIAILIAVAIGYQ